MCQLVRQGFRRQLMCVCECTCWVAMQCGVEHAGGPHPGECSANGSTIIWDLRQKKPWCELRDAQRGSVTDIAWNP